jgi:hypothetical protein
VFNGGTRGQGLEGKNRAAGRALLEASTMRPTQSADDTDPEPPPVRTQLRKKRIFSAALQEQYAEAADQAKRHLSLQEQQLELMNEEREERRQESQRVHEREIRHHQEVLDSMHRQNETQDRLVEALLKLAEKK